MNTDNADHGLLYIEKGALNFTLRDENDRQLDGHELFTWDDPKSYAEKMAKFYRVPIHGTEQMKFQTVKP